MAVELTPRVAQQTAGFGFQVPVFRMNQGVSAATANPMSRAAMQPMEMVSEGQFGLNPNVMAMADEQSRAQFFAGVDELNQFVNKAAEFGIDPSKVDMSVPESFALNQEFRKRVQGLQQQARAISTGAAQTAVAEREMDRASMLESRALVQEQRQESMDQKSRDRLSKKYISRFRTQEDLLLRKAQQDLAPSQVPAFKKNAQSLINAYDKQLSEIEKSTESQEDKDFLIEELNMRKSQIAPFLSGEAALYIEQAQPGTSGPTSLGTIANLGFYEGLLKKQLFENPIKMSPTSSRVGGFALLSKTGDPKKNVLKPGSFDQEIDVTGYEQGFSYISQNGERIPVRAQFAKSFPKANLVPTVLLKGRANITPAATSIALGKDKPKATREVVFVPSNDEWLMAVNAGYNDNAVANQIKAMIMQGGGAAPSSGGSAQGLDSDLVF